MLPCWLRPRTAHAISRGWPVPGVVWELAFGSWVLLQPERINAYAQAVIRTLQADEHQRGCLMEERVLKGDLAYESSMPRFAGDEERFVLLAMHQTPVERGIPSPAGRKKIAQRFIAGVLWGHAASLSPPLPGGARESRFASGLRFLGQARTQGERLALAL